MLLQENAEQSEEIFDFNCKMKDLGEAEYCLEINITRNFKSGKLRLDQENTLRQIFNKPDQRYHMLCMLLANTQKIQINNIGQQG